MPSLWSGQTSYLLSEHILNEEVEEELPEIRYSALGKNRPGKRIALAATGILVLDYLRISITIACDLCSFNRNSSKSMLFF